MSGESELVAKSGSARDQFLESLPPQALETADVSPLAVTVHDPKPLFYLRPSRNRIQEGDGSIPFISTKVLSFFFWKVGSKRFAVQSFQTSDRSGGESATLPARSSRDAAARLRPPRASR